MGGWPRAGAGRGGQTSREARGRGRPGGGGGPRSDQSLYGNVVVQSLALPSPRRLRRPRGLRQPPTSPLPSANSPQNLTLAPQPTSSLYSFVLFRLIHLRGRRPRSLEPRPHRRGPPPIPQMHLKKRSPAYLPAIFWPPPKSGYRLNSRQKTEGREHDLPLPPPSLPSHRHPKGPVGGGGGKQGH